MLMTGRRVKANDAVGWLIDFTGSVEQCLQTAWKLATGGDHGLKMRPLNEGALKDVPGYAKAADSTDPAMEGARIAIMDCIQASCGAPLSEALGIQAKHSGNFMTSKLCRKGAIGTEAARVMNA